MRMKRGRGYVAADKNFDEDLGIGWIPIDSVHSPVKKVNYLVEAARLGQTTDYDKLTIEVWTNAAVTPRDSVSLAAKLIRDHFTIFVGLDDCPQLGWRRVILCHRKANAVHEEQRRFVAQASHALDLKGAYTFLACARGPERITPMPKRDARFLKHGSNANRVVVFAAPTPPEKLLLAFCRSGLLEL
jgi:hypothetical protein